MRGKSKSEDLSRAIESNRAASQSLQMALLLGVFHDIAPLTKRASQEAVDTATEALRGMKRDGAKKRR